MIILSNNLWNCDLNSPQWAAKGEDCSADARVDGLAKAYKTVLPDIIGYQEMSRYMEQILFKQMHHITLPDGIEAKYELITGGYTPLMYRYDKYRLLESGHFIFPLSFYPYEGCFNDHDSKSYTFGVFEDRINGKHIIVFTAHLWWKSSDPVHSDYQYGSAEARAGQMKMICKTVERLITTYDCPVILMGDFNDKLDSLCLNEAKSNGFKETHSLCTGYRDDRRGYHYCYADGWRHDPCGVYEDAIDHILIKNTGSTVINEFHRFMEPYFECLSDHFPVYIDISI